MGAQAYFARAVEVLQEVARTQSQPIGEAAGLVVDAIVGGKALYAFGATHSFMVAEELVYRTGGLMLVNPVYPHGMNLSVRPLPATSQLERVPGLGRELLGMAPVAAGDVVIVASTSGRNPVPIDFAMAAVERGAKVIGITSMAYTRGVTSRHASGKKLVDVCTVVIDNGAPYGDAAVQIEGFRQAVGPLSSVTGCAIANAIVAETVTRLVARGYEPPVFMSANVDGGDAYNSRLMRQNAHRVHYLE